MAITIVAIGRKHESWIEEGVARYQKRLRPPFNIEWVTLPHSSLEGARAREEESERILSRIKPHEAVVLLDERGDTTDSPSLSSYLDEQFSRGASIVMVIGGAYGVDATVRARANRVVSLSKLVFPHQLVRLILVEQLYRAQQIAIGGGYHHV